MPQARDDKAPREDLPNDPDFFASPRFKRAVADEALLKRPRDIQLPNESGTTDIRRDTSPYAPRGKPIYYRDSIIPARRASESEAAFSKRDREFGLADKAQARREARKSRSMRGGKR